ncbi:unnamed protein product [Amoebophrya sp. A120]|nr:unnamed protein product [Amoebophrya sp. A120]|eukprot:GSA120T00018403001.1
MQMLHFCSATATERQSNNVMTMSGREKTIGDLVVEIRRRNKFDPNAHKQTGRTETGSSCNVGSSALNMSQPFPPTFIGSTVEVVHLCANPLVQSAIASVNTAALIGGQPHEKAPHGEQKDEVSSQGATTSSSNKKLGSPSHLDVVPLPQLEENKERRQLAELFRNAQTCTESHFDRLTEETLETQVVTKKSSTSRGTGEGVGRKNKTNAQEDIDFIWCEGGSTSPTSASFINAHDQLSAPRHDNARTTGAHRAPISAYGQGNSVGLEIVILSCHATSKGELLLEGPRGPAVDVAVPFRVTMQSLQKLVSNHKQMEPCSSSGEREQKPVEAPAGGGLKHQDDLHVVKQGFGGRSPRSVPTHRRALSFLFRLCSLYRTGQKRDRRCGAVLHCCLPRSRAKCGRAGCVVP